MKDKNDPEMLAIKNSISYAEMVEFFKGKDLGAIRLPLNNRKALEYLCWLNSFYTEDADNTNYLNYCINIFSCMYGEDIFNEVKKPDKPEFVKIVRPPTINEEIMVFAKGIVDYEKSSDTESKSMGIAINAGILADAYHFLNYPALFKSGIGAAYVKFGTWDDNPIDFDFITFEESCP